MSKYLLLIIITLSSPIRLCCDTVNPDQANKHEEKCETVDLDKPWNSPPIDYQATLKHIRYQKLGLPFPQEHIDYTKSYNYDLQSDQPFFKKDEKGFAPLLSYPIIKRASQGDPLMQSLAGIITLMLDDIKKAAYWFELAANNNDEFSKQALEIINKYPNKLTLYNLLYDLLSNEPINQLQQCLHDEVDQKPYITADEKDFYSKHKNLLQLQLLKSLLRSSTNIYPNDFNWGIYDKHPMKHIIISCMELLASDAGEEEGTPFLISLLKNLIDQGIDEAILGLAAIYVENKTFDAHFEELYEIIKTKTNDPLLLGIAGCYLLGNSDYHNQGLELIESAWQSYPTILEWLQLPELGQARLYAHPQRFNALADSTARAVFFFFELLYSDIFYPLLGKREFMQTQNALELFLIENSRCNKITMHATFMRLVRLLAASNYQSDEKFLFKDLIQKIITCDGALYKKTDDSFGNAAEREILQFAYGLQAFIELDSARYNNFITFDQYATRALELDAISLLTKDIHMAIIFRNLLQQHRMSPKEFDNICQHAQAALNTNVSSYKTCRGVEYITSANETLALYILAKAYNIGTEHFLQDKQLAAALYAAFLHDSENKHYSFPSVHGLHDVTNKLINKAQIEKALLILQGTVQPNFKNEAEILCSKTFNRTNDKALRIISQSLIYLIHEISHGFIFKMQQGKSLSSLVAKYV